MQILVLNGSPRGDYSITLQTVLYLEQLHPEHSFEILPVGRKIKAYEKDFSPAREALLRADLILFSYPVYTFLAPCQLHQFISLMKADGVDLTGKFATQLSTSKHFYDVTAHRYIEDNCADMGLTYIKGLSADMEDLLTEQGQKDARDFFDYVCWNIHTQSSAAGDTDSEKDTPLSSSMTSGKKPSSAVIITDCPKEDTGLQEMISRFRDTFPYETRLINLREYPFKGGCLGCFQCASTGDCIYGDGFDRFLREEIQTASAMIYAFTIKDHSMGPLFKMYNDRQFCNGHRTVTMGTPVAYLIQGPYSQEFNLQMVVQGRAQVGGNFLAGIVTDEADPAPQIRSLSDSLCYALEHHYAPPKNFYGVGGMKIFRDLIWTMQGLMRADHKFFKAHGQYDFPQKHRGKMMAMYLVGSMMSSPKLRSKMGNKMNEGMLMPYKKLLEKAKKGTDK